jgi:hypothetical protein
VLSSFFAALPPTAPPSHPELVLPALAFVVVSGVVLQIVSYWIASKLVASEESRFLNALKLWGTYLLAALGLGFVLAIGLVVAAGIHAPWATIGVFVIGAISILYIGFSVPMKIYSIGFLRTLAFLVIAVLMHLAAEFAIGLALTLAAPDSPFVATLRTLQAHDPAAQRQLLAKFRDRIPGLAIPAGELDSAIAANRAKPMAERIAALQRMKQTLDANVIELKSHENDQTLRQAYLRDSAQYEELRKQVQTDAAKR